MTRPDRILYPDSGFTKADALRYYRAVAKHLLPHLRNRPVSFKRYPDTIRGESFWEKDAPSFTPGWVKRVRVPRRGDEPDLQYVLINDLRTVTWVADVGGLELHPFLHVAPEIDLATHVVFDLDPGPGADLDDCCRVALLLRDALEAIGLDSYAKVSGGKGLQVYVPLNSGASHAATEPFARVVAEELSRVHPKLITAKMTKALRTKKVFIDWSQNADYKTTVAVYSLRARTDPPLVSMPVTWEEVKARKPLLFSPGQALARVKKRGDLFAPVLKQKQRLPLVVRSPLSVVRSPLSKKRSTDHGQRITDNASRLPKPKSQSGRRLFLLTRTGSGSELWLDMHGHFERWILRPDRHGSETLIALPAGELPIEAAYYRGEVPARWKGKMTIEDAGAYELIDGSYAMQRFDLFFTGKVMQGEWTLEVVEPGPEHRSWVLSPA